MKEAPRTYLFTTALTMLVGLVMLLPLPDGDRGWAAIYAGVPALVVLNICLIGLTTAAATASNRIMALAIGIPGVLACGLFQVDALTFFRHDRGSDWILAIPYFSLLLVAIVLASNLACRDSQQKMPNESRQS